MMKEKEKKPIKTIKKNKENTKKGGKPKPNLKVERSVSSFTTSMSPRSLSSFTSSATSPRSPSSFTTSPSGCIIRKRVSPLKHSTVPGITNTTGLEDVIPVKAEDKKDTENQNLTFIYLNQNIRQNVNRNNNLYQEWIDLKFRKICCNTCTNDIDLINITDKLFINIKTPLQGLTWGEITKLSIYEQNIINRLRVYYINKLLEYIYNKFHIIKNIEPVGTTEVTSNSDIDFNMEFILNITDLSSPTRNDNTVIDIYKEINRVHNIFFPKSKLFSLFDINIYGSSLPIKNTYTLCQNSQQLYSSITGIQTTEPKIDYCFYNNLVDQVTSQRIWSVMRLFEKISEKDIITISSILTNPNYSEKINLMLNNTLDKINTINNENAQKPLSKENKYYIALTNFYINFMSGSEESPSADAIEAFSRSKYYEDETYRSLGAYLFTVLKMRNLDIGYYIDSAFDDLGFAVENLVDSGKTPEMKNLRAAKYLERSCDALIQACTQIDNQKQSELKNVNENDHERRNELEYDIDLISTSLTSLDSIKDIAKQANELRKKFIDSDENQKFKCNNLIISIIQKLELPFQNKINSSIRNNGNYFIIILCSYIFHQCFILEQYQKHKLIRLGGKGKKNNNKSGTRKIKNTKTTKPFKAK